MDSRSAPDGRWKILTIQGAISAHGMIATMTVEAARDRKIFLADLDEVLCPKLWPGDVVGMDNFSSHQVKGVRERIEAAGPQLLYLPPCSPDLNPIEKTRAKRKQLLRTAKAPTKDALIRPSLKCCHCSPPRMHKLCSDFLSLLYSNRRDALELNRFII